MLPVALYGVNSQGRNQLFAFCLVRDDGVEENRDLFEFVFRQFLTYMENHVPKHILMKRMSQTSSLF